MSRKSMMVALAAAVSLGTFAMSSSDASAFRYSGLAGGGAHPSSQFRLSGPVRLATPVHPSSNLHLNNYIAHANLKPILGIVIKPPYHHHHWWWWSHWRPYWIGGAVATGAVAAGGVSYATSTPATNRCSCLTKEYTPQGAVVFKDVCTNEMAMNPPASDSPAADMAPQMPQQPIQQGYLQPQAQ